MRFLSVPKRHHLVSLRLQSAMTLSSPPKELQEQAASLVSLLAQQCALKGGFGSFSSVAYDSAWVSLVQKEDGGVKQWRFPECFQYLMDAQRPDGGWLSSSATYASAVDAILNVLAALLALKRHLAEPLNCNIPSDMDSRISKATMFLQGQLEIWDVKASENVGFEILVPTLLQLLEQEGVNFRVPGLPTLKELSDKKLAKFDPRMLYGSGQKRLTLVHSLEAFIGRIDFDKVGHLKASGSMMASPAATAAYLMYSSKWDEEAEQYLSTVIATGSGKGGGGVPSAFPTPIFELSWVLSTLLLAGFSQDDLGRENVGVVGDFLEHHLHAAGGLLGFGKATSYHLIEKYLLTLGQRPICLRMQTTQQNQFCHSICWRGLHPQPR